MLVRLLAAALLTLALSTPAHAATPANFYGTNWDREITTAPDLVQDEMFRKMRTTGVETVRTSFRWDLAQPEEGGAFDHSVTDVVVARASERHVRVLPIVIVAPSWARTTADNSFAPPRRPREYAAYLTALIGRYGPDGTFWTEHPELPRLPIHAWQIWNEPHLQYQWTVGEHVDRAQGYARLLRVAYDAVKAADPEAQVVLAGLTNYSPRVLAGLYRAGVHGDFDVAAIHAFTRKPRNVLKLVRRFRRVMRNHGDGRKLLWATEIGLPASEGRADSDNTLQTTDRGMARFLTKTFRLLRRSSGDRKAGATRAYWYTWASAYSGEIFDYAGLFRYRPGGQPDPRPALRAYRRMAGD
jgi:hypothetical protein